jgi:hypothetical protein
MTDFIRNIRDTKYGQEGEVYWKLFDRHITLLNLDGAGPAYMEKCAAYLNGLDESLIDELCRASLRYRDAFYKAVSERRRKIKNPRDVLGIVKPRTLVIPEEKDPDVPVVSIGFSCEWEPEHGMQWLVREGRILFVGPQGEARPWADKEDDEWNFAP